MPKTNSANQYAAFTHRGRDSQCRISEMEPIVGSRGQVFSVAGSPSAGFGVHCTVAERVNSSHELLDVAERGVYSSYTLKGAFILPIRPGN